MIRLRLALSLPVDGEATAVAWSADGSRIAAAWYYGIDMGVWDANGTTISEFNRNGKGPYPGNSLSFLREGAQLITPPGPAAPEDAALTVWNTTNGTDVKDVPGPAPGHSRASNSAYHFAVTKDGAHAAVVPGSQSDFGIAIYDTLDWRPVRLIVLHDDVATSVAFSPDGRTLAVGTIHGVVELIRTQDGDLLAKIDVFSPNQSNPISTLAFSPDGMLIAAGGGLGIMANRTTNPIRVYTVQTRIMVGTFQGEQPIRQITWVLNGQDIAFISGGDGTLHILNPRARTGLQIIKQFSRSPLSIAASPHGENLLVTDDNVVRMYRIAHEPNNVVRKNAP